MLSICLHLILLSWIIPRISQLEPLPQGRSLATQDTVQLVQNLKWLDKEISSLTSPSKKGDHLPIIPSSNVQPPYKHISIGTI